MSLWWAAAQHLVFQVEREEREGGRKGDLHVAGLSVCRSVGLGGAMDGLGLCVRAHTPLPRSSLPGLGPCLSSISGALPRLSNHPLTWVHGSVKENFVASNLLPTRD